MARIRSSTARTTPWDVHVGLCRVVQLQDGGSREGVRQPEADARPDSLVPRAKKMTGTASYRDLYKLVLRRHRVVEEQQSSASYAG